MKTFKKILCTLLVVVMCLTSAPLQGFVGMEWPDFSEWFAGKASAEGYYSYMVINGEVTITDVNTSISGDITIPATLGGYSVTTIGYEAFQDCYSLTSVTIPDSVTTIGEWAFYSCYSLTSVTIPDSVTSIGDVAFASCTSLTSIVVDINNSAYSSDSRGVLFNKNKTILIQYPVGNTGTSYTIPDSVTSIRYDAFNSCDSLTSVTIPDSVTTIGEWAFAFCTSLTSVTIPDSVTYIGERAFTFCTSLTSIVVNINNSAYSNDSRGVLFNKNKTILIQYPVGNTGTSYTIPNNVTTIGDWAFYYCTSLTSVTIPDSVTTIGNYAFEDCTSLTSVTIPDSVTTTGGMVFADCDSLTSVTIPDSVTSISDYAFADCDSLTSVIIPDSVTYISDYAFGSCDSLTSVTIPDSVTTIGSDAFCSCTSLTSVTIPDSVTTIGYDAFNSCDSLTNVTIPDSVTSIGHGAFANCDSLTSIVVDINNSAYSNDSRGVLFNKNKTMLIQYPTGNTGTSYTIPDSVTTIDWWAFDDCGNLTSVTIPDSVTTIGYSAFENCDSLTSVTIPDSVKSISDYAFADCDSLTSVTIPDSVKSISDYAFADCYSLTSVTIPDSVKSIGERAFAGCYSLTSVTIPDSVTSIGYWVFEYCTSLTDVYYKGTEEQWKKINIYAGNECLFGATIHYNSSVPVPEIDELEVFALQLLTDELNRYHIKSDSIYYDYASAKYIKGEYVHELLGWYVKDGTKKKEIGGNKLNEDGFDFTGTSREIYEQCLINEDKYKWKISEIYQDDETGFFAIVYDDTKTNQTVFSVGASNGFDFSKSFDISKLEGAKKLLSILFWCIVSSELGDASVFGETINNFCYSKIKQSLTEFMGNDWGNNDFVLYLSNTGGSQIPYALDVYETYSKNNSRDVTLTGHSLGAALATLISTRYSIPATVFDSIPMLDVSYYRYYTEMGEIFSGCDEWEFVDIMNNEDVLAGAWEKKYKNYIALDGKTAKPEYSVSKEAYNAAFDAILEDSNYKGLKKVIANEIVDYFRDNDEMGTLLWNLVLNANPVFQGHNPLANLVQKDDGSFEFAEVIDTNKVTKFEKLMGDQTLDYLSSSTGYPEVLRQLLKEVLTNVTRYANEALKDDMLILGSSKHDNLLSNPKIVGNDVVYGGNGDDSIITDDGDDVIVGGRGDDGLYGGYGDDQYIYYKGDGVDFVSDFAGNDTISLFGFNKNDKITVETADDGCKHICVSGELIMKVAMYRSGNITNSIEVEICDKNGNSTASKKIQDWNSWKSKKIVVACPVYIEILNPQGEVVLTLENKETELIENEYGVFYVKQISEDEFAKYIYLYDESYTVRVVGEADGTMSYTETTIDENGVKHISSADEIEITSETVITSSTDGTVLNYLKDSGADLTEIPLQKTNEVPIESIELNKEEITLCIDNTFDLITIIEPINATVNDAVYYSVNPTIADVDSNGRITAKTEGTAEIVIDFGVKEAKCNVTVTNHSYEPAVTPATCHSTGFTTNTCKVCGDSYTSDVTNMIPHNMGNWYVIKPAECQTNGAEQRDCSACDYSETQNVPETGHNYNNGVCTSCGDDLTANCSCNCHAGGIKGLIFKIILFFQKLFRMNRICEGCGARHY